MAEYIEKNIFRMPDQLLVGEFIRRSALSQPNKIAVSFKDKDFTYREFNKRINKLANAMLDLGVKKGDKVSLLLYNRNELLEIFYASQKIGAVACPLNFRLESPEIKHIINDSDSTILFVEKDLLHKITKIKEDLKILKNIVVVEGDHAEDTLEYNKLLDSGVDKEPEAEVSETDPSLIIYSSGTTGLPKGAVWLHKAVSLLGYTCGISFGYTVDDIGLAAGPLYSGAGLALAIVNLHIGASLYILPMPPFNPIEILKAIHIKRCGNVWLAPIMLDAMLMVPEEVRKKFDVTSMHSIISVGSPLHPETRKGIVEWFGDVLYDYYGAIEFGCGPIITPKDILRKPTSDGKAAVYMEVKVIDDEGNELPPGEIGEIAVGGPTGCSYYYKNPEATRELFLDGFIKVGDVGYKDEEGYIYLVDRKKDMIVSGAANVYPAEVERIILSHPKVANVAVIGIPDEKWGERVHAIIIPKQGVSLTEEEVIEWCRGKIAGYKIPKSIELVSELPINPSGKVQKYILKEKYWKEYKKRIH